jgi:hypothetical protein
MSRENLPSGLMTMESLEMKGRINFCIQSCRKLYTFRNLIACTV